LPYTPPTGNAITFNFFGSYLPPFGSYVPFQFGIIPPPPPPPPPGASQLPTGMRAAHLYDDEWFMLPRRRFAPPIVAALGPISLRHDGLNRFRLDEPEPWIMPRRTRFAAPRLKRRAVLFTVT
jgi:hypothetical protein